MNVTTVAGFDPLSPTQQMGFFTWSVPENMLFGDEVFADLYELPAEDLAKGISVEIILQRIVEQDREVMAKQIHEAIVTGRPSAARYQILCPSGARKTLFSTGRCFHDAEGIPSYYPGMVISASEEEIALGASPLATLITAAIAESKKDGRDLTRRYLSSALRSLGSEGVSK